MEKNLNFISLVAIGNFNPAILTSDFLNDDCQLGLGKPTEESKPILPVVKQLKFQNINIEALFDRFQIKETGPDNIYETRTLKIFSTIFEKLHYTPLRAVGVNINCDIPYGSNSKGEELVSRIVNPDTILSYFEADQLSIQEKYLQTKKERKWSASNYIIEDVGGLKRSINIINKKDSCSINYNYEAGNLHHDKKQLDLFLDSYKNFCDEFYKFLKYLEG